MFKRHKESQSKKIAKSKHNMLGANDSVNVETKEIFTVRNKLKKPKSKRETSNPSNII